MNKKIIINSGTGLIGKYFLNEVLKKGYKPYLLTRNLETARKTLSNYQNIEIYEFYPVKNKNSISNILDDSYAVINFSGAPISKRKWTDEYKKILISSRVDVTKELVNQMKDCKNKPRVFINMSAIGYYGFDYKEKVTEKSPPGKGFIPELCINWEKEAMKAKEAGIRTVVLRTGIVLTHKGGALGRMTPVFKMFLGGVLGTGKQWMPFIHIDDLINLIFYCIENESIEGALNATSPHQVTNYEFTKTLAKVLKKPAVFKIPSFVLKIVLGDFSINVLEGIQVIPEKTLDTGFKFKYEKLENALTNLLAK